MWGVWRGLEVTALAQTLGGGVLVLFTDLKLVRQMVYVHCREASPSYRYATKFPRHHDDIRRLSWIRGSKAVCGGNS